MLLFVICLSAFAVYCAIVALFSGAGRRRDVVRGRIESLAEDPKSRFRIDEELEQPFAERFLKPIAVSFGQLFQRLVPERLRRAEQDRSQEKSRRDAQLQKLLSQAGLSLSPSNYRLLRLMIMAAALLGLLFCCRITRLSLAQTLLFSAMGPVAAYVILRYVTAAMATARKKKLERGLPDILDILSISVEAGLGFEQAIGHITRNMSGPMVDEFAVSYREMSMGRTRREAMQAMADRCDFDDLRTFTGAVIQAGQLGISIKNVLRSQSSAMRLSRKTRAQERAQKVSTKILIPMLIFIFPVLFIILLGPAAMNILKSLR